MFRARQSKTITMKLCDYFQVGHLYEIEIKSYTNGDIPEISTEILLLKEIINKDMMVMHYLDDPLEKSMHYLYDRKMIKWLKKIS